MPLTAFSRSLDPHRPLAGHAAPSIATPNPVFGPSLEPNAGRRPEPHPTSRQVLHDLNNQLMIVVGLADLCLETLPEGSAERQHLEMMVKAGGNAVQIVNAESRRLREQAQGR